MLNGNAIAKQQCQDIPYNEESVQNVNSAETEKICTECTAELLNAQRCS